MRLHFPKMHGLGNDSVVIDAIRESVNLSPEQVRYLADRRFGVGCDQVLLPAAVTDPRADFRYIIYNADGGEVEHCGNGVRCLGRFLVAKGLTDKNRLTVQTFSGLSRIEMLDDGLVRVDMGVPMLEPARIPFEAEPRADTYRLEVDGQVLIIRVVPMGNPHAVTMVPSVDDAPVSILGPRIENHERFPNRVNAGFMEIVDPGHIRLRVHERGAGETLACGTGACAAVVAGRLQERLSDTVR